MWAKSRPTIFSSDTINITSTWCITGMPTDAVQRFTTYHVCTNPLLHAAHNLHKLDPLIQLLWCIINHIGAASTVSTVRTMYQQYWRCINHIGSVSTVLTLHQPYWHCINCIDAASTKLAGHRLNSALVCTLGWVHCLWSMQPVSFGITFAGCSLMFPHLATFNAQLVKAH